MTFSIKKLGFSSVFEVFSSQALNLNGGDGAERIAGPERSLWCGWTPFVKSARTRGMTIQGMSSRGITRRDATIRDVTFQGHDMART